MTTRSTRGRLFALAAVAALVLLLPTTVAAHAELLETTPADGATVVGTPEELVAIFDDELLVEESSLSIRNAQGERLAVGHVDPDEKARLLIADVPELAVGPTRCAGPSAPRTATSSAARGGSPSRRRARRPSPPRRRARDGERERDPKRECDAGRLRDPGADPIRIGRADRPDRRRRK